MPQPTTPPLSQIDGLQYRLLPSRFPTINLFEHLLDPSELETAYALEVLTNPRLRDEAGDIHLVAPDERVVGAGSSVVMAAFTHIGFPSRFTDGSYGVYYAGLSLDVAIAETVYHRERFLSATKEPACTVTLRCYSSRLTQPLHDVRSDTFDALHAPDDYSASQKFGTDLREQASWGLHYRSVRRSGGECVAIFRPKALKGVRQGAHYAYVWDGERVRDVLQVKRVDLKHHA